MICVRYQNEKPSEFYAKFNGLSTVCTGTSSGYKMPIWVFDCGWAITEFYST